MSKSLKFLILNLLLTGISFGSNAQGKLDVLKKPCTKEVRCSKLDSAQHDLETIPFLKEEIEAWKVINTQKDARILEQANDIVSQADEIAKLKEELKRITEEKDHDIEILKQDLITANKKVTKRGWQRLYAYGLGYLSGKIF